MISWISHVARTTALGVLLISGTAFAQYNFVAGKDYNIVNPPQPTDGDATVEVLEFFAYGCIHCFQLSPKTDAWAKRQGADTKLKRIPTPFAIRGVDSGPIYYTLEAMGLIEKLHIKLFEAIHNDNVVLGNPEVRMQWLAKNGVDVKKYQQVEKSFSVDSKVKRAVALTKSYRIESTPTLVVHGKYTVANQGDRTFQVVDGLAAGIRAQSAQAVPAAAPAVKKTGAK